MSIIGAVDNHSVITIDVGATWHALAIVPKDGRGINDHLAVVAEGDRLDRYAVRGTRRGIPHGAGNANRIAWQHKARAVGERQRVVAAWWRQQRRGRHPKNVDRLESGKRDRAPVNGDGSVVALLTKEAARSVNGRFRPTTNNRQRISALLVGSAVEAQPVRDDAQRVAIAVVDRQLVVLRRADDLQKTEVREDKGWA